MKIHRVAILFAIICLALPQKTFAFSLADSEHQESPWTLAKNSAASNSRPSQGVEKIRSKHQGEEYEEDSGKRKISTGKYIAGGIVGTAVGFGIGHGIHGTYGELGWLFTVGEVAALTVAIIGELNAAKNASTSVNVSTTTMASSSSASTMIAAGLISYIGFHIWETIDVWTRVSPGKKQRDFDSHHDSDTRIVPLVATNGKTSVIGLGLSF